MTERGEVRSDDLCLSSGTAFTVDSALRLERCNVATPSQRHIFKYDAQEQKLTHVKSGRCVSVGSGNALELHACDGSSGQHWTVEGFGLSQME
ncbi:hypothetical protein OESDEN_03388 [Oesophagostomum dentatum]|uniref:Ricin B lectin domain-containing protein n=1 Tax=Oesophagostomum dentatum TaxID=61180 RepID=A0A0B1TLH8_OESDE|nr:hypothetical protein OESDEN_03388 [Oesophagostomum dentatum]